MKIKTKLSIGFSLIALVTVISGFFSVNQAKEIYHHSKEANVKNVSLIDAVMEVELAITTAHLWFEEVISGAEDRATLANVWKLLEEALWYCNAMLEGGKSSEGTFYAVEDATIVVEIIAIKQEIEKFRKIAESRFSNLSDQQGLEDHLLDEKFDLAFEKLINITDTVETVIQAKTARDNQEADTSANHTMIFLTMTTFISIMTVFVVIYYSYREIMREVGGEPQAIAEITRQVAAGHLDLKIDSVKQVATGIYAAIQLMVKNLKAIRFQQEEQNWLKSGQTQLSNKMSGEQNVIQLAENIINFMTPYVEAQVGVFYLLTETGDKVCLKLLASYAYTWRKNLANEFKLGEGLVGQVALERKPIIITTVPDDYLHIQSGLGGSRPSAVLVMPLLYENTLKGVIELASLNQFSEIQLELLKQVAGYIAITLNTAESRVKMRELLQQSQAQTDILQQQSEQLQIQQEELQQTNEELQSQAEELQTQQEELRQTNEELEKRTQNLEQQREEIRKKNQILEETQKVIEAKAQELEIASKYKSEFLANMSHELRTPLNSLLILAQLLAENKDGNLSEKQLEYAKTIHSAGFDLLTLINDILDLSKVEAGKVEVNVENVILTELVTETLQKFRPVAEEKGLIFKVMTADHLPAMLRTDPQRLKQIINNLLSNAFKFTSQGEVKVMINRLSDQLNDLGLEADKMIAIHVIDTGVGIPKDKQRIIFEAFQQADGTTSRRYGGTGLGLSISRQLARLLGGEIQIHSQVDQGSTFTFYFPEVFIKTKEVPINLDNLSNSLPKSRLPKITEEKLSPLQFSPPVEVEPIFADDRDQLIPEDRIILVIEDDRKFSNILLELAHERHFKCIIAEDGKTGLQLTQKYQPNAIILDVGLPQLNGWTVMEQLKGNPQTCAIPVHFISAVDRSQEAKKQGAIGYLHKPVDLSELNQAFSTIEQFISKSLKKILIMTDHPQHQREILELINGHHLEVVLTSDQMGATQQLATQSFDCVILDADLEKKSGIHFLEQLDTDLLAIPVIIYATRELTAAEELIVQHCADHFTLKQVRSPQRLLDEATLFLHQLEAHLPKEEQRMLRMVHNKEALLEDKKVLIVDDDIRNTFALMTFLEDKKMEVIVGNNGKEALILLNEQPDIAIILMDVMMPEMDGYEAIQQIRAQSRFRKLPIIALTAKAMKGDKSKCIEAGANDYLSKPIDTDRLLSLMRVWLYP
ncbi:MAG: hypothetical protein BWK79_06785 [Beggiatoa sp. IS2]|nr:MAG: hypothetical protein BWK79_06785 [Beggiatoa sp. IS2]